LDFSLNKYQDLITTIKDTGKHNLLMSDYFGSSKNNCYILRHDVDRNIDNALKMAKIEKANNVKSTYYFRIPKTFHKIIIQEIAGLGHEIGYHYENMGTCYGDINKAWDDFRRNLDKLRRLYPVKTICMHGSPLSKFDNRDLWKKYNYRSEEIIGEPYLDIDWDKVFYLTDTGRKWDGNDVSIRDKVRYRKGNKNIEWPVYHSTNDIIRAIDKREFPARAMITIHPQRWHDNPILWTKELMSQGIKNVVKRMIIK